MNITNLPDTIKTIALAFNAHNNVPVEMTVSACIGLMAYAVQGRYQIDTQHFGIRPLNTYTMALVPSGGMKSEIFTHLAKAARDYDKSMMDKAALEIASYTDAREVWENERKSIMKERDRTTMLKQLKDHRAIEPVPPKSAKRLLENMTSAGLFATMANAHHSIGLLSPEAGSFLGSHGFTSNDVAQSFIANLNKLWNSESCERNTGSEQQLLHGRHLSMVLLTQEETLTKLASNPLFEASGFAGRILLTSVPAYRLPTRSLTSVEHLEGADRMAKATASFNSKMAQHLNAGLRYNDADELELETVRLETDAFAAYDSWQQLEGNEAKHGNAHPFFQKYHEHVLRLAAVMATFDGHRSVPLPYFLAAIELVSYYGDVWAAFDGAEPVTASRASAALADVLKKMKPATSFTVEDFKTCRAYRNLNPDERRSLREMLLDHPELDTIETKNANGSTKLVYQWIK